VVRELSLLAIEARRSTSPSCTVSSTPFSAIADCPPIGEIEECPEARVGLAGICIPSRSPTLQRLELFTSFSLGELRLPGTLEGQEQLKSLRWQPPQIGRASSHFFLRRLQVQHPVRTRTIRVVRRSGIVFGFGGKGALSGPPRGRLEDKDKNQSSCGTCGVNFIPGLSNPRFCM